MALIAPWRQTFCPYCCHRFHLSQAPRRMRDGPRTPDQVVGDFLTIPPPDMERVLPVPRRGFLGTLLSRFIIADDWRDGARKLCPHDHMFLPTAAAGGHLTPKVVAIIGTRSSGKSNFFGVLIKKLKDRFAHEVNFSICGQETFSVAEGRRTLSDDLCEKRYHNRLFHPTTPVAVPPTQGVASTIVGDSPRIPLIYQLKFPNCGWVGRWRGQGALDLAIFDAAGEDLRDEDPRTMEQFYRFLLHAAGIIFLIDPTQVRGIRERLTVEVRKACPEVPDDKPATLLQRVINFFQTGRGVGPHQRIRVPVAFAFSKSDLLDGVIDRTALLHHDSHHQRGFNHVDCRQVSDEVVRSLNRWGEQHLVTLIDGHFADYSFFALSALGQMPREQHSPGGRIERLTRSPEPVRIADPLLWILWRCGYIPEAEV